MTCRFFSSNPILTRAVILDKFLELLSTNRLLLLASEQFLRSKRALLMSAVKTVEDASHSVFLLRQPDGPDLNWLDFNTCIALLSLRLTLPPYRI